MSLLFGGIEAGGTKFVCAIGDGNGKITQKTIIPTETPNITISEVIKFFRSVNHGCSLAAIGIASFGPIDLNKKSPHFGYITNTPRAAWRNYNFASEIQKIFRIPIEFDTDVNGAALGECCTGGAANGLDTFIYITVGTGIGMGGMVSGNLMHGLIHPEMGHMLIARDPNDTFVGTCRRHKNCLSGLASGLAMQQRWHIAAASDLPPNHPAWNLEADYLSLAIANCILVLSPQKIILGGGVIKNSPILPKLYTTVPALLNGYVEHEKILEHIEQYIVSPMLGDNAGVIGALALAKRGYLAANV